MRRFLTEFLKRGLIASAGGPVILAIIYGILGKTGVITSLSPHEVCIGILTITLMAFIAAGITAIYQTERLPLISAILIHGGILYFDYRVMYLLNNWIQRNLTAIGIFTVIFIIAFALIWVVIYLVIRTKTDQLNRGLKEKTN